MPTLTVDMRMINASGIGTYLSNLIPLIISKRAAYRFNLLGDGSFLERLHWASAPNINIISCEAPIYSISEQWVLPKKIPPSTTLFWSPHYNIPLNYKGALLVTVHDVLHLARPDFVRGWHQRVYAKYIFSKVATRAQAILCDSDFTRQEFIRHTGHLNDNFSVIHLGVDASWMNLTKNAQSPHKGPYIVFVGNVKPHKNLRNLLYAFELILGRVPHDLIIIGKADGFRTGDAAVVEKARSMGERVILAGEVDDATLQQYVAHADMLVLPSLYEGFGLPAVEAMACRCPVLVADIPPLREVCADGALLCDPLAPGDIAEKILELISNGALRASLITKGKRRAQDFSWGQCADQTLQVIDRLCA